MPQWPKYDTLEVKGSMLMPGFSIYLMEIHHGGERYFYVGMTGDSHYPSARAAFHRISGHLEITERSTQNQLYKAIRDKMEVSDEQIPNLHIKMHHWPIDGFTRWTETEKVSDFNSKSPAYQTYSDKQQKIHDFENAVIHRLKNEINLGDKLLNNTKGKETDISNYQLLWDDILKIVTSKSSS